MLKAATHRITVVAIVIFVWLAKDRYATFLVNPNRGWLTGELGVAPRLRRPALDIDGRDRLVAFNLSHHALSSIRRNISGRASQGPLGAATIA
jgi:hypothetical protein